MDVNKGFYLPDCLDEQTIVYFSSGLDNSAGGYKVFSKVELIEEIARILAGPASSLLDRGACYMAIFISQNSLNYANVHAFHYI